MCGIAGYVGLGELEGAPLLDVMNQAQRHRGPDGQTTYVGERFGFAHQRLAIIDRAGGQQPMVSRDGRYVLIYNGEVYNFRELREELAHLGREFRTASDTEVVLVAYEVWGQAAFDRFNGMFALAIADTTTGTVVLARDHFGIKPLYLATGVAGEALFASEIGALLATGRVARRPDDRTIYRYLRYRVHDDTERTFFDGITRLLPGQAATITPDGRVHVRTYTRLYEELRDLAERNEPYDEDARRRFAEALTTAIEQRLVSDVPVGTALSGGLDSSTIVATLNRALARHSRDTESLGPRQQTFSAIFPGELNDEERYIDAVAATCSDSLVVHKVAPSPQRFIADLSDFLRTQQEPVVSTAPYAQYCVMREASKHVTVMIDGQGADELLAGYAAYHLVYLRHLRRTGGSVRAAGGLARSLDVLWRMGRFRLFDRLHGRDSLTVTDMLAPAFLMEYADERFDVVPDDIKRRLEDDVFRHSLPCLLRYEDHNTMRFSIEGRVPFCDVDLMRTLWAIDPKAIVSGGWNKRVLRDVTADLLPPDVRHRRNKIGFTIPERTWFPVLAREFRAILSSPSFGTRPYWHQPTVVEAFDKLVERRAASETMLFWRLLNVELWLRTFIDNDPTSTIVGERVDVQV
ncbi:asparagine synthase (glutamine-hydrolyzing) [Thermasporomyces composti]|uniref:asparagine synthase (glutamine-hydrolyzing) n=1 Tax=Thermasporomyces composti TaxID=696763 RepID=A0A3D9V8I0_THECX|nr:asparagine synthase (glutamine-hydrolyzing) [Thermasporomyces composti]REF37827.1 asparagine synthase (glutamine-hydrolysing) [Thermasporomyces composti]